MGFRVEDVQMTVLHGVIFAKSTRHIPNLEHLSDIEGFHYLDTNHTWMRGLLYVFSRRSLAVLISNEESAFLFILQEGQGMCIEQWHVSNVKCQLS